MGKNKKTGILIINLGTPDSTKTSDVRRYLREFLFDPKVIQIPAIPRWILVNMIIAPFRSKKSAEAYKQIWSETKGSPLKYHTESLTKKISKLTDTPIEYAMRYQNPSIQSSIKKLVNKNINNIIITPLFPQYSEAASGSAIDETIKIIKKYYPEIKSYKVIREFYDKPEFIEAYSDIIVKSIQKLDFNPDYYLFSYHGLPEKQLDSKTLDNNCNNKCSRINKCPKISDNNKNCYRAQCYATTDNLINNLKIKPSQVITCFQSRLGKIPWIQPYLDNILIDLAKKNAKNIVISCPAFVCDCLETLEEISIRAEETWKELGGDNLICVPCLNDEDIWAKSLLKLININKI